MLTFYTYTVLHRFSPINRVDYIQYSRTGSNGKARRIKSPEETFKTSHLGVLEREHSDTVVDVDIKREIFNVFVLILNMVIVGFNTENERSRIPIHM